MTREHMASNIDLSVILTSTQVSDLFFNREHPCIDDLAIREDATKFAKEFGRGRDKEFIDALMEDFFKRL